MDYGGNIELAQKWLDTGLDFIAIHEDERLVDMPFLYLPAKALLSVYERMKLTPIPLYFDLMISMRILYAGLRLEPVASISLYHYYKNNMPWANLNFRTAKEGVYHSAKVIADVWSVLWTMIEQEVKVQPFSQVGQWPNVDLWIQDELFI